MPNTTAGIGTKLPESEATPADGRFDPDGVREFLQSIYRLNKQGLNHLAIDEILRFFDDALLAGNLVDCREALRQIDEGELSASMMKTVLVITGKAKSWLPERTEFFARAMEVLAKERGREAAERILNKHR